MIDFHVMLLDPVSLAKVGELDIQAENIDQVEVELQMSYPKNLYSISYEVPEQADTSTFKITVVETNQVTYMVEAESEEEAMRMFYAGECYDEYEEAALNAEVVDIEKVSEGD